MGRRIVLLLAWAAVALPFVFLAFGQVLVAFGCWLRHGGDQDAVLLGGPCGWVMRRMDRVEYWASTGS